jgi:hypothetical protein
MLVDINGRGDSPPWSQLGLKNVWSLDAGEVIVAEIIPKRINGAHVFFPVKDIGVDLVIVRNPSSGSRELVTVQVKTSKWFEHHDGGAISITREKMGRYADLVDFLVILIHRMKQTEDKPEFVKEYLIVPFREFLTRSQRYKKGKLFYYYFSFENDRVIDTRGISRRNRPEEINNPDRDYSAFLGQRGWDLLNRTISGKA